ncbi:hypothetical protein EVAR_31278_1 [Eumeta japonica]|uniref:Uncharacterized protein n=1 Tax=Eumeta variegata TaxID=151549 RepID=A0A4C1VR45_EUMVA|nr:hypothetical protein EVAR_31278_1 [Eumeta japonica]
MSISPGLAVLLNGSTFKTLLSARCCHLRGIGFGESDHTSHYKCGCDVRVLRRPTPTCIKAPEVHEVVVYEDRGENLNYLLQRDLINIVNIVDTWGNPITTEGLSGSKRLQRCITEYNKAVLADSRQRVFKQNSKFNKRIRAFLGALERRTKSLPCTKYRQGASTSQAKRKKPTVPIDPKTAPTRAQKGEIDPPALVPIRRLRDHYAIAFSEFIALTSATLKVHKAMCEGILKLYQDQSEAQLTAVLKNAKAAIYDNDSQTIQREKMSIIHTAAYSATNGLVTLDKEQTDCTERPNHITASYDPIVVTARCTRVALEERLLDMVKNVTWHKASGNAREDWEVPDITWVNRVLGCSKTTWVVKYFELERDVVITITREATRDLK